MLEGEIHAGSAAVPILSKWYDSGLQHSPYQQEKEDRETVWAPRGRRDRQNGTEELLRECLLINQASLAVRQRWVVAAG